jgi:hypothetical protein
VVLACDVVQFLEGIVGQLKASASNIEIRSLPTLDRCFPRGPAAAGSLIPLTLSLPLSRPLGFAHLCRGFPARSIRSIEIRSLPTLAHRYPCDFAFYVADPVSSVHSKSLLTYSTNSKLTPPRHWTS